MIMLVQQAVPLTACHRKIHPYSSPPIRVRQLVDANIMLHDGQSILSAFLIVEGDATPLLGKATAVKLGLLRVGVCHVTGSDEYSHKVVDRFPKLWTGIGCLKGVEVKHRQISSSSYSETQSCSFSSAPESCKGNR